MAINIHKDAKKYLARLSAIDKTRLETAISRLSETPPKGDIRPYAGKPGTFRLKVNDHRVIFTRIGDTITVTYIKPRGQAYTRKTRDKRG